MPPANFTFNRANYPADYLARGYSEARVQSDILKALHAVGIAAWHVDSGGRALRSRAGAGGRGVAQAGLPDVFGIIRGGRALQIEVKKPALIIDGRIIKPAGRPSQAQIEFIARALDLGAAAGFAWSVSDALKIAGKQ